MIIKSEKGPEGATDVAGGALITKEKCKKKLVGAVISLLTWDVRHHMGGPQPAIKFWM
jgi:hypothetical protein